MFMRGRGAARRFTRTERPLTLTTDVLAAPVTVSVRMRRCGMRIDIPAETEPMAGRTRQTLVRFFALHAVRFR